MSDAPPTYHHHDPPSSRRRQHRHLPSHHHHLQLYRSVTGLPWLCLLLLVISSMCTAVSVTSGTSGHNRRRSGLSGSSGGSGAGLTSLEDTGDKSVPDQLALAASRRGSDERSYPRRGSVIHSRTKEGPSKDYNYGHVELNLVRPEQESHPKLLLSTTTAASGQGSGASVHLEDSQSAAEYVANAIKLAYNQPPVQIHLKAASQVPITSSSSTQRSYMDQREREREREREQQLELEVRKELQQQQKQQQQQQQHQQHLHQRQHLQQQQQQQQQQLLLLSSSATASSSLGATSLGSSSLGSSSLGSSSLGASSLGSSSLNGSPPALAPAPVYEKEPVTRSYDIYEGSSSSSTEAEPLHRGHLPVQEEIERHYRPKYHSSASYNQYPYRNLEAEAEEKVRVSASTEIPKSEIMKQIEKSVIKYMKELEAEGKILSTPQEPVTPGPPPLPQASTVTKSYYKTQVGSSSSLEDKRYSSSTMRPKYTVSAVPQQQQQQQQAKQQQQIHHHQVYQGKVRSSSQKPALLTQQQHFQSETETAYQAPDLPVDELSPNVEFIYKIKTRAPLQTATVKTVSKPYTLPLKSAEHFDHGAALKNIEEFDLSHVVPTPERVERERDSSREDLERGKSPHKLYFNSEIYHDINSLPYKSKEAAAAAAALHEYQRHKLKATSGEHLHQDYKGYSGYFAEPEATEMENEDNYQHQQQQHHHHHHHAQQQQPYHHYHVVKKEPLEEHEHSHDHDSWLDTSGLRLANAHALAQAQGHHGHSQQHSSHSHIHAQHPVKHQSLDYDSYSPKFNNNPEGYGYQHTYKGGSRGVGQGQGQGVSVGVASPPGKRGKRGNGAHPRQEAIKKQLRASEVKDLEASLALRPPPK